MRPTQTTIAPISEACIRRKPCALDFSSPVTSTPFIRTSVFRHSSYWSASGVEVEYPDDIGNCIPEGQRSRARVGGFGRHGTVLSLMSPPQWRPRCPFQGRGGQAGLSQAGRSPPAGRGVAQAPVLHRRAEASGFDGLARLGRTGHKERGRLGWRDGEERKDDDGLKPIQADAVRVRWPIYGKKTWHREPHLRTRAGEPMQARRCRRIKRRWQMVMTRNTLRPWGTTGH